MGSGETGGAAALPVWVDYMRTALAGAPEVTRPRPAGLLPVASGDGREDYIYAENQSSSTEEVPNWLREMFHDDSPALEAPEEAIPPGQAPRSNGSR
jgi:penicillin-binding protein 1A